MALATIGSASSPADRCLNCNRVALHCSVKQDLEKAMSASKLLHDGSKMDGVVPFAAVTAWHGERGMVWCWLHCTGTYVGLPSTKS